MAVFQEMFAYLMELINFILELLGLAPIEEESEEESSSGA